MGQLHGGCAKEGWQATHMSRPARPEQGYPPGALSTSHHRRHRDTSPWSQGLHRARRQQGGLACGAGRGLLLPHHVQLTIWKVQVEENAIRHLLGSRGVSAADAPAHRGVTGVEVVADDFVVVGFGDTLEGAVKDHDQNLDAVLRRRGIKLNSSKVRLRRQEVPFIGHVTKDKGLRADPTKVQAITQMPRPTDVAGVQRLLGMIQYLAKFLPNLSDITKPLRELTHKEVEWVWDQPQENAFRKLQEAVTSTPVLRYYNLAEEVTIQCDASQTGLGAALMPQENAFRKPSRVPPS